MENSHCTPIRNAIDLVILRTRTSPSRRSGLGCRAPSRSRRITMIGAMGASSSDCARPLRRHGKPRTGKPVKRGGGAPRCPVCLCGSKTRQRLASQTGHRRKEGGAADVPRRRFRRNHFQKAVPSVPVKDCVEALGFYCDVLGFQKDFDDSVLGVKRTLFAGVSRGDCALTLNPHDRQAYRLTIGCRVDALDLLCEAYRSRGVKIILPLRTRSGASVTWRSRTSTGTSSTSHRRSSENRSRRPRSPFPGPGDARHEPRGGMHAAVDRLPLEVPAVRDVPVDTVKLLLRCNEQKRPVDRQARAECASRKRFEAGRGK